ncbi:MAG TPA: VanZ family protein [Pyrinomonadaceae bacterium]|nr:VanZ family protein [Pyrinomonadaceae bacterium]
MNSDKGTRGIRRCGRLRAYAPLIIWIGVILILGSGAGSSVHTSRFIRPILEFFFPDASLETLTFIHGIIRKSAHFFEYALLGLLSVRCLRLLNDVPRVGLVFLFAILLSGLVAAVDEGMQSFDPRRTGSAADLLIDLVGAVFGAFIGLLIYRSRPVPADNDGLGGIDGR